MKPAWVAETITARCGDYPKLIARKLLFLVPEGIINKLETLMDARFLKSFFWKYQQKYQQKEKCPSLLRF